jgi:hypothetical protein
MLCAEGVQFEYRISIGRLTLVSARSTGGFILVVLGIGVFNEEDVKGLSQGASVDWGRGLGGTVTRATFEKYFELALCPK